MATAHLLLAWVLAAPVRLDPPAADDAMGPSLTRIDGAPVMTWIEKAGGPALRFSVLRRGRWSPAQTIVTDARLLANWADFPSVTRAGDGAWVAAWTQTAPGGDEASEVHVARSTDKGRTWSRLGAAHDDGTPTEHGFPALLAEGKAARLAWLDGRETAKGGPMTLRTAIVGAKLGPATIVDDRVCDCCQLSLASAGGAPLLAWRDRSPEELRDIAVARLDASPSGPAIKGPRADRWKMPGCPVNGPALGTQGERVVLGWFTAGEDNRPRVQVGFSQDAGATFFRTVVVDDDAPIGRVSVAAWPGDGALVQWMAKDGAVKLARVSSHGPTGAAYTVVTLPPARQSGFPRLLLEKDTALVAFTEAGPPSHVRAVRVPLSELAAPGTKVHEPAMPLEAALGPPSVPWQRPDGAPFDPASLRGKPVLVNLWATFCAPCRREMPRLAALAKAHPALQIVTLSADEDAEVLRKYLIDNEIPGTVLRAAAPVPAAFTLPSTWLLGERGEILLNVSGELPVGFEASVSRAMDLARPR